MIQSGIKTNTHKGFNCQHYISNVIYLTSGDADGKPKYGPFRSMKGTQAHEHTVPYLLPLLLHKRSSIMWCLQVFTAHMRAAYVLS